MTSAPERIVQFGTGALLRGLVDAIVHEANQRGSYDGRIVAIGSTGSGRDRALNDQNGRFTLLVQGIQHGKPVRAHQVITSVSRALSSAHEWDDVLRCARNPDLEVVVSNTTEVGITFDEADAANPDAQVPRSFPGKLVRFLHERARAFDFAPDKGLVVVPCELIERNGDALRDVVLALADRWRLGAEFTAWLSRAVRFCNTLVDRIVPGAPSAADRARLVQELGYDDALFTVCEPYRLLAIEGDAAVQQVLRFARPELGAIVVPDVTPYRERKLRLLNGSHSTLVSLALLAGCETVREAITHEQLGAFARRALFDELVPSVAAAGAASFAAEVLERFANPYIEHRLRDITLHGGMKMRVRVVPSIVAYAARHGRPPAALTLGFAAYVLFASVARDPAMPDDVGERLRQRGPVPLTRSALLPYVRDVCSEVSLWGADLSAPAGLVEQVVESLLRLQRDGATAATAALLADRRTPLSPATV